MKRSIGLAVVMVLSIFANIAVAQDAKTIKLEQRKGEFVLHGLTVSEGTYVFEVTNNGVDHEVGLVVAPKGKTDQANHIKEAYVQKTVADGKTEKSSEVKLKKGEYVYFCPLNPTEQYPLTVQ